MTKNLTTLLLTLLVLGGCSNEDSGDHLIYYEVNSQTPFTGSSLWYYENGQLEASRNWKDGEQDGPEEIYYENGQLSFKRNWKDGELDGPEEYYYENGQLSFKGNWKDGKEDGPYEVYYENGQLKSKGNLKDGKEEGLSKNYDENGKRIQLNSEQILIMKHLLLSLTLIISANAWADDDFLLKT